MQDASSIKSLQFSGGEKNPKKQTKPLVIQVERNHSSPLLTFAFIWKELNIPGGLF